MNNILNYSVDTIVSILDEISDVIIITKDARNFWVNRAFCELFGYSKEEAMNKGPELVLDSNELSKMMKYYNRRLKGEPAPIKYETIAYSKDKKKIFIEVITKFIKLDNEDAAIVEIHDITNKRKIFDSLITNEQVYQYSLDNTPVPIIIHSEGKIVFTNPATLKLIKLKNNKTIIGKPIIDFVHPDHRKQAITRIQKMAKTGELAGKVIEKFLLPDGRVIDVEVFAFPVNFRGKLSYQVYFSDITERIMHEQVLSNSEERFRLLFESLPIGIFIYDKNFMCIDANKSFEAMVKAPKENIIGIDVLKLNDRAFIDEIKKTEDGSFGFYEGKYITTISNESLWIIVNTAPILDSKGCFDGGIGIFTDISKQKELESQFIQAQKLEAVGRLTGGIAHDFNNILTVIKGYSDLVLKRTDKKDKNYNRIKEIKKAGDNASELIQQLMAFSRKQIIRADVLDISEVVYELKGMISRIIGEEIKFQIVVKGKIGLVFADKSQLNQVILNLLVNAKDALDERDIPDFEKNIMIEIGEVYLDDDFVKNNLGSRTGRNVSLSVVDNGIGIKEEILNKIFEPFYTTKQKGKGTGLGLSTVYGIVKQNSGYIYAKSKPGSWTIFTTLWPVEEKKSKTSYIKKKRSICQKNKMKVLIVEDEETVRNYITESLRDYGFTVFEAENGVLALEEIRENTNEIDCVISDIVMPVMDGERLAEIISEECPQKKIILMSGYTASDILLNKIKEKDYAFIRKPFIIDDLIEMIQPEILG